MGQGSRTRVNAIDGFSEPLDRLHATLDAACVVGTWDWDHIGKTVVYDMGAAKLLTGDPTLADREIQGMFPITTVHPADHEWLVEHMERAVSAGGLILAEYRVVAEDGKLRWLLSRGRTYQNEAGHPLRTKGILIDITEMHDGGERYVLGSVPEAEDTLERTADLAIALKQTLNADVPSEVHAAADLLLFTLGQAIARADRH